MKARLDFYAAAPEAMKAMIALEGLIKKSGLEQSLMDLVKIRASQINGCAFCINMHTHEARKAGESEERIYLLNAWAESPVYSDRERAALAWTDAVTRVADGHVPDAVFNDVRPLFSDAELGNLTVLVGMINAWNRLAISFRAVPQVKVAKAAA